MARLRPTILDENSTNRPTVNSSGENWPAWWMKSATSSADAPLQPGQRHVRDEFAALGLEPDARCSTRSWAACSRCSASLFSTPA